VTGDIAAEIDEDEPAEPAGPVILLRTFIWKSVQVGLLSLGAGLLAVGGIVAIGATIALTCSTRSLTRSRQRPRLTLAACFSERSTSWCLRRCLRHWPSH
jgi:hypothetical protein